MFDYADPDVVAHLQAATGGGVAKALDAISVESAQRITAGAFGPAGGKMIVLLGVFPDLELRKDVEVQRASTRFAFAPRDRGAPG